MRLIEAAETGEKFGLQMLQRVDELDIHIDTRGDGIDRERTGWSVPINNHEKIKLVTEHVSRIEATDLIEQWRDGDSDAATKLYELYCERLMRVVSGQLLERYQQQIDPEDVLQTAFRTFFGRVSEGEFAFEDDKDVWKLLVTVVLNKLRRQVRHMNAQRRDVRREIRGEADFDGQIASDLSRPPGIQEAVEFAELINDLFQFLPEDERKLLQLRIEGYSQKEIAEELDVTDRTVRRMWERVRERLVMLLAPDDDS